MKKHDNLVFGVFTINEILFAFDETIANIDFSELGTIGDYYYTFLNREAITSFQCWEKTKEILKDKEKKIPVIRGIFRDELPSIPEDGLKEGIVKLLNYTSQQRKVILITKKNSTEYENIGISKSVIIKSVSSVIYDIEKDESFQVWKSRELLRIQKMDSGQKAATDEGLSKELDKKDEVIPIEEPSTSKK